MAKFDSCQLSVSRVCAAHKFFDSVDLGWLAVTAELSYQVRRVVNRSAIALRAAYKSCSGTRNYPQSRIYKFGHNELYCVSAITVACVVNTQFSRAVESGMIQKIADDAGVDTTGALC